LNADTPSLPLENDEASLKWVVGFIVLSGLLHIVVFSALSILPKTEVSQGPKPMEWVTIEVPPPPQTPPPPEVEKPVEKVKPPPLKVDSTKVKAPPPPAESAPPPPNETPPPETPQEKPVLVTGITLQSTSTAGSFAAPVGNTMYGRPEGPATEAKEVKAYSA
jgi:protein TonB